MSCSFAIHSVTRRLIRARLDLRAELLDIMNWLAIDSFNDIPLADACGDGRARRIHVGHHHAGLRPGQLEPAGDFRPEILRRLAELRGAACQQSALHPVEASKRQ